MFLIRKLISLIILLKINQKNKSKILKVNFNNLFKSKETYKIKQKIWNYKTDSCKANYLIINKIILKVVNFKIEKGKI